MRKEGAAGGPRTCQGDVIVILIDDFLLSHIQGALGNHVIGLLHTGQTRVAIENVSTRNMFHNDGRKDSWVTKLGGVRGGKKNEQNVAFVTYNPNDFILDIGAIFTSSAPCILTLLLGDTE